MPMQPSMTQGSAGPEGGRKAPALGGEPDKGADQ